VPVALLPKPNRSPRKIIALKPLARHYAEHTKSCGAIDRHHEISKGTTAFFRARRWIRTGV
jgi:hypothetical protein